MKLSTKLAVGAAGLGLVAGAPLVYATSGFDRDYDRGLHYGDGLFETIGVRAGVARFLESHLARLASGCARLGIVFNSMAELRAEIAAALALAPPRAMLKIIVTRGSGHDETMKER